MKMNVTEHFCTKLDTCEHIERIRSLKLETEYAFNKALYDRCSECGDYEPSPDLADRMTEVLKNK